MSLNAHQKENETPVLTVSINTRRENDFGQLATKEIGQRKKPFFN